MRPSKHNIVSRIADSEEFFIVNLLTQNADILSSEQFKSLLNNNFTDSSEWKEKGYLIDEAEEKKLFQKKYLEFLDNRDSDEIQLFFVPTYACNFSCAYCYQDQYQHQGKIPDEELIEAFFDYISKAFVNRPKYITLFGGEPLLDAPKQKEFLLSFIENSNKYDLDLAVVTNGYNLEVYLPILKNASVREIQVTLDGVGAVHDSRRPLHNGQPTFDRIVKGIDQTLAAQLPVNLRMIVDKENINGLPDLARFAIKKGWTKNPLFKTQLGRNYELHHCQINNDRLYTRLDMYKDIYQLLKINPEITEFHRPAFSVAKFLFDEGKLPDPLFDSCPGTKTEWAFDYDGNIYSCTATVGKKGEELGAFYPEVRLNQEKIWDWEKRDVLAITKCRDCSLQLACGGGCASVAKNNTGNIQAPDCRPVKELLELGIAHYFHHS